MTLLVMPLLLVAFVVRPFAAKHGNEAGIGSAGEATKHLPTDQPDGEMITNGSSDTALPTTDEHGTTAESLIVTSEEDSIISSEVSDTSQAQVTDETTFPTSLPEETTEPSTPNSVSSLGVTLLCTVNQFVNRSMVAPDDGLCELTFYDSFFKNQTYDLAAPYNDKFNYFIELATQHVKTEYGAAFAYSYEESKDVLDKALSDNPSKVQADLMSLLHQNITHFGTVDIGHVRFGPSVLKRVLRNLKRVYDIVEDKRSNQRPVYTIMTIPMYLNDSGVWMKEMSDYLNHSGLPLHGVIAIPHLTENDLTSGYACRIVPPMFLNAPNIPEELERLNPYTYSMTLEYEALSEFASKKLLPSLFVTVPLHGKWYPYDNEGQYTFDTLCGVDDPSSPLGSVAEVCKNAACNTTYVEVPHVGLLSACEKSQMVFTYDNDKSYRYKLCILKKNLASLRYGILAVGINMDDTTNKCGQGSYARLRTLRWLVEYFNTSFNSPDDYDRCQRGP